MSEENPINRRRFFREGLGELLKPVLRAIAPIEEAARQISQFDLAVPASKSPPNSMRKQTWLRPPGALAEDDFLYTCSRCAECVKVCPAQCISIDATGAKGAGAPYIEANVMPCVVCEGLKCMNVCPSGALVPTLMADIDMGTAQWTESSCLRIAKGDNCTICVDKCPLGSTAIELKDGKINVIKDGCIGCGVCEHECPTLPRSIVVLPKLVG